MRIAVGSDHAGYQLKQSVLDYLSQNNIEHQDLGVHSMDSVDYPDYGVKVGKAVAAAQYDFGIVICGTGLGISIAANKVKGIRAALCCTEYMAEMARAHNDANVLALGGRTTYPELAMKIVKKFLDTKFEGGRHAARVDKIHNLTGK